MKRNQPATIDHTRRHALSSLLGLATAALLPSIARANAKDTQKSIVMVIQVNGPNLATDQRIAAHLGARGYSVQLVDQDYHPELARGASLIVVSSTVSSKDVLPGWRTLSVPLVTWENDLLDDLAMSGKRHDVDFGETEK
ncbi:MAG: hypothetical protein ACN6QC_23355, partial [Paraburkholderia hospita]